MPKNTVIYHSTDFDGLFCREIARKFLPPDTEFIGWNFGDAQLDRDLLKAPLVVMDLPLLDIFGLAWLHDGNSTGWICDKATKEEIQPRDRWDYSNIVWIDHHKTSIDSHPQDITGYRIDGVAACRLAWQWFTHEFGPSNPHCHPINYCLPNKQEFIDRAVIEPLAVRLAGEYDIWDKRDPRAEQLQYGLRCDTKQDELIRPLLDDSDPIVNVDNVLNMGYIAQLYARNVDASICNSLTWIMEWEGLKFLCVNHARFNSLLFAAKDKPETGHDALLGFRFDGKQWMVSLYHANHRKDIDLSEIAKKHGGGGHRGACGFTCKTLPFNL